MAYRFGILVFPDVQQLDLTGPFEVFASVPDSEVHLLWKDKSPLSAVTGLSLTPTTRFAECPPLDVLCVPGGRGVNALLADQVVLDFVRDRAETARYVTSVCTGALVLGAAGLLQGKRVTTHWNAQDFLADFGGVATEGRVVQDGRLITAGGVTAGIDFGLAVVAELLGRAESESIQLALEYAPAPPFRSGTPAEASPAVLEATRKRLAAARAERERVIAGLKEAWAART